MKAALGWPSRTDDDELLAESVSLLFSTELRGA
jgi:hypothetical protein